MWLGFFIYMGIGVGEKPNINRKRGFFSKIMKTPVIRCPLWSLFLREKCFMD